MTYVLCNRISCINHDGDGCIMEQVNVTRCGCELYEVDEDLVEQAHNKLNQVHYILNDAGEAHE